MVYLFGMDVPLMELLSIISVLMILGFIALIYALFKEIQINKKLDLLMKEEYRIKKELDIAELEENKQIILLRHIVNEIASLHGIRTKGVMHLEGMKQLADEARSLPANAPKEKHTELIEKMVNQIAKLDQISIQETRQLAYIRDIIGRVRAR